MAFSISILAQEPMPYTLTTFYDTYVPIKNGFLPNIDPMWDVPMVPLNLQFEFPCFEDTADMVWLSDIGGAIELRMEDGYTHLLSATNADLNDVLLVLDSSTNEGSIHSYETIGNEPNRIFKIEFKNVGFDWEMMNSNDVSTANFQFWLYENGDMEIRFGPNTINSLDDVCFWETASLGISSYWDFYDLSANFLWGTGNPSNPEFIEYIDVEYDSLQIDNNFPGLSNWPDDGQVYKFGYDLAPIINIDEISISDLIIYPNPASKILNLKFSDTSIHQVEIKDLSGKKIQEHTCNQNLNIDVSFFSKGVYTVSSKNSKPIKLVID